MSKIERVVSFSIKSMSINQDEAWSIGFHRCLAELRRIAKEVQHE